MLDLVPRNVFVRAGTARVVHHLAQVSSREGLLWRWRELINYYFLAIDDTVPGEIQGEQHAILAERANQIDVALRLEQVPANVELAQSARLLD